MHIDNKGKNILIFGEGPTQGLDDTTLTAEEEYPINLLNLLKLQKYINPKQKTLE